MAPRTFPFMILAAGVVAASLLSRKATTAPRSDSSTDDPVHTAPHRITVQKDVPALGLARGDLLRIESEALIHVGDVVALRSGGEEVVLTRFHDELMHCTAGLVVRERAAVHAV